MKILNKRAFSLPEAQVEEVELQPPQDVEKMVVGIDPGTVHLGIAVSAPKRTSLIYEVKMERDKDPVARMIKVQAILRRLLRFLETEQFVVIIEAASFSDKFRQSEMAEQRAAVALFFNEIGADVRFIQPNSVTKQVFGTSKTKAGNEWPELPKNAAAALACSFYPLDNLGQ